MENNDKYTYEYSKKEWSINGYKGSKKMKAKVKKKKNKEDKDKDV